MGAPTVGSSRRDGGGTPAIDHHAALYDGRPRRARCARCGHGQPWGQSVSNGAEASAGEGCRDSRGRERSPSDCRILEQLEARGFARESQREKAADVRRGEADLKRASSKLAKSKKRLAAAARARRQATTEQAKQRTGAVKRRRAAAVRRNKAAVRQAKADLSDERGNAPAFCG